MIHAAEMVKQTEDNCNQTFVCVRTHYLLTYMHNPHPVFFLQYETYVDIYADNPEKEPEFELQTFYGHLKHIITVHFDSPSALRALGLGRNVMTFVLAAIRACAVEEDLTTVPFQSIRPGV